MWHLKATADTSKISIQKTSEGKTRLRVATLQPNETGQVHNLLVRVLANGGTPVRMVATVDDHENSFIALEADFEHEPSATAAAVNIAAEWKLVPAQEADAMLRESAAFEPLMEANPESGLITFDLPVESDAGGYCPIARVLAYAAAMQADIRNLRFEGTPTKPNGLRTILQGFARLVFQDPHGKHLLSPLLAEYCEQLGRYWSGPAQRFLPLSTGLSHRPDVTVCLRWSEKGPA